MASSLLSRFCALSKKETYKSASIYYKYLNQLIIIKLDQHFQPRNFNTSSSLQTFKNDTKKKPNVVKAKVNKIYTQYEEFTGLADVQRAQQEVKKAERNILEARDEERSTLRQLTAVREKLKHVRERISHIDFTNPLYPVLANEQHELVTQEEKLLKEVDVAEQNERDKFMELSTAMRRSYEKERVRVERTKNWSLIGTVVGAIIGMLGSVYINRVRTNDLKTTLLDHTLDNDIKEMLGQVIPHAQEQYDDIKEEIKKLQVCLINKLVDPPQNERFVFSKVTTSNVEEETTVGNILKSFQMQLMHILEKSTQSQKLLSDQNEKLFEQVVNLKLNNVDVDSNVYELIGAINNKLDQLQAAIQGKICAKYEDSIPMRSHLYDPSGLESPNEYAFLKHAAIWGAVMGTLYYIISV